MEWDYIGNLWAVEMLRQHLKSDQVRHAYLFTGAPGIGRRTLALRFAQALNCLSPDEKDRPCGTCRACTQIARMQHPDFFPVQVESGSSLIKVEQIRTLQHNLSLSPYESPYRIGLLINFEQANASAQNALLKTLEEAPPRVILLLTAENTETLLPTIVSRCEVLRLRPLSLQETGQILLSRYKLPSEKAQTLAHLSGGRIGMALNYHEDPALFEQRERWLQDLVNLLRETACGRFAYALGVTEVRGKARESVKDTLRQLLQVWISFWRDILLTKSQADIALTNLDKAGDIERLAQQVDFDSTRATVSSLQESLGMIDQNVNLRLLLEVLLLDFPYLGA